MPYKRKAGAASSRVSHVLARRRPRPALVHVEESEEEIQFDASDDVCCVCEHGDHCEHGSYLYLCDGGCFRVFHDSCAEKDGSGCPASEGPDAIFLCRLCRSSSWYCALCLRAPGGADDETDVLIKCQDKHCGKRFHRTCLESLPLTRNRHDGSHVICPRHTCAQCALPIQNETGSFSRCIRCPLAYHRHCQPPNLYMCDNRDSLSQFICPKHLKTECSWITTIPRSFPRCVLCDRDVKNDQSCPDDEDGDEDSFLCNSCPNSYHRKCLSPLLRTLAVWQARMALAEPFSCWSCRQGRLPLDYDVVWAMIYRKNAHVYWPARIVHRAQIPSRVMEERHKDHYLPIQWFGIENAYAWVPCDFVSHISNQRFDTSSVCQEDFQRAVAEAQRIWSGQEDAEETRMQLATQCDYSMVLDREKPLLSSRNMLGTPISAAFLSESWLDDTHAEPASHEVMLKVFYTGDRRGWGVMTLASIPRGATIIEYVGDIVDEHAAINLVKQQRRVSERDRWFVVETGIPGVYLDTSKCGNKSRFINHSCCPNVQISRRCKNGALCMMISALQDIPPTGELVLCYNVRKLAQLTHAPGQPCFCGANYCTGQIEGINGTRPSILPRRFSRDSDPNGHGDVSPMPNHPAAYLTRRSYIRLITLYPSIHPSIWSCVCLLSLLGSLLLSTCASLSKWHRTLYNVYSIEVMLVRIWLY
ncbi:putative histone-lysine N-methyltransferase Mes-4 [Porphyridium purpureum]|uniref:Putative histone-lysine N-methyltransferase Mes-4 n=1 Tax=Porphyridium purpureum TaxID=35688 RepID=A0A5J4YPR0_PORPP|nr:putative histone-lysine N-methyltransferase Mes-4 [Porphyridium purpureum]|eukprot:POR2367..scf296_7